MATAHTTSLCRRVYRLRTLRGSPGKGGKSESVNVCVCVCGVRKTFFELVILAWSDGCIWCDGDRLNLTVSTNAI